MVWGLSLTKITLKQIDPYAYEAQNYMDDYHDES